VNSRSRGPGWRRRIPASLGILLLLAGCAGPGGFSRSTPLPPPAATVILPPGHYEGVIIWAAEIVPAPTGSELREPELQELFLQARDGNSLLTCLPQPNSTLSRAQDELVFQTADNAEGYVALTDTELGRRLAGRRIEVTSESATGERAILGYPCTRTLVRVTRTAPGGPTRRDTYEVWSTEGITLNPLALWFSRLGEWDGLGHALSQVSGVPLLVIQSHDEARPRLKLEATSIMRGPVDLEIFAVPALRTL
jgi:hypothetical protein